VQCGELSGANVTRNSVAVTVMSSAFASADSGEKADRVRAAPGRTLSWSAGVSSMKSDLLMSGGLESALEIAII
jgi:hypothetical protein